MKYAQTSSFHTSIASLVFFKSRNRMVHFNFKKLMEKKVSDSICRKLEDITRKFYNTQEGNYRTSQKHITIPDLLHSYSSTVTAVFNHPNCCYDSFSSNCKALLGYDHKKFLQGNIQFLLSLLHPGQRDLFENDLLPLLFKYYHLYSQKRKVTDLKFSFTIKLRRSDGSYIWTMMEVRPFKANSKGQPVYSVVCISDVSLFKKDELNEFKVYTKSETGLFKTLYSVSFSSLGTPYKFSRRELEIISLLAEG